MSEHIMLNPQYRPHRGETWDFEMGQVYVYGVGFSRFNGAVFVNVSDIGSGRHRSIPWGHWCRHAYRRRERRLITEPQHGN